MSDGVNVLMSTSVESEKSLSSYSEEWRHFANAFIIPDRVSQLISKGLTSSSTSLSESTANFADFADFADFAVVWIWSRFVGDFSLAEGIARFFLDCADDGSARVRAFSAERSRLDREVDFDPDDDIDIGLLDDTDAVTVLAGDGSERYDPDLFEQGFFFGVEYISVPAPFFADLFTPFLADLFTPFLVGLLFTRGMVVLFVCGQKRVVSIDVLANCDLVCNGKDFCRAATNLSGNV